MDNLVIIGTGTIRIEESCFLGANSLVFNDCNIGTSCLIGGDNSET